MKSSRSLNPSGIAQTWLPIDFIHNLVNPELQEDPPNGEAIPLFEPSKPSTITDRQAGGLMNAETALEAAPWLPTEFTSARPEKQAPPWMPAIRYNTAANAAEIATQIINDARRQADEIIHQAEIQAKSIQEQSYQDGWNTSLDEIKHQMDAATTMIQETINWRDDLMTQSEPMVLELIRNIAQKLFGEGFQLDSATLQGTFNNILENARSLGNLRIYVNPDDSLLLGPYWRELQESITTHKVEIIPSNSISRGGCYVNGQWGSADGRIGTQLKAILETLIPEQDQIKKETEEE